VRSAFGEFQARPGDEVGNDSWYQYFARLALRHNASCRVNGNTTNIAPPHLDLSRMETGPKWQTDLLRGRAKGQCASNCAARSVKRGENAIAGSLDQTPTMLLDNLLRQLIMTIQQATPCLIAFLGGIARWTYDICKKNRGEYALEITRRSISMPSNKLVDIPEELLDIAADERVVTHGVFDKFGARD
jgi:hypothetical protein